MKPSLEELLEGITEDNRHPETYWGPLLETRTREEQHEVPTLRILMCWLALFMLWIALQATQALVLKRPLDWVFWLITGAAYATGMLLLEAFLKKHKI